VDVERLTAGGINATQEHVPNGDVKDSQLVVRTDKMVSDDPIAGVNVAPPDKLAGEVNTASAGSDFGLEEELVCKEAWESTC
jgi:hypothetical protein